MPAEYLGGTGAGATAEAGAGATSTWAVPETTALIANRPVGAQSAAMAEIFTRLWIQHPFMFPLSFDVFIGTAICATSYHQYPYSFDAVVKAGIRYFRL